MDFITAVKTCFSKYVTFSGRAQRSEFWWFMLFGFVTNFVLGFIPLVGLIWSLALMLPNFSVTARRLHDTDRSGWWMLAPYGFMIVAGISMAVHAGPVAMIVGALGFVMMIVLIVWLASRGIDGENRFGPDPLETRAATDPAARFLDEGGA